MFTHLGNKYTPYFNITLNRINFGIIKLEYLYNEELSYTTVIIKEIGLNCSNIIDTFPVSKNYIKTHVIIVHVSLDNILIHSVNKNNEIKVLRKLPI